MSRLAISHDWLLNSRGAERVLSEFCALIDHHAVDISIYTLFLDSKFAPSAACDHKIHVSALNSLPWVRKYYRYLLPLFRRAIQGFYIDNVEALLSISHSVAKAIPHSSNVHHVCYCLSPMRYLWEPELYGPALNGSFRGRLLELLAEELKRWDLENSRRVNSFVAISETVRKRIQRVYARDAETIYPCVDLDFYCPADVERGDFYLAFSALVPQKRIELAVEAFNQNRRRLLIVGSGPCHRRLSQMAGDTVRLLGWLPDCEVRELYRTARALIFPGCEDFGLVPVEAQACGCPVIAYGRGGLTETVIDGETGVFFSSQTTESLNEAVRRFEEATFDSTKVVSNAGRFSRERFQESWRAYFRKTGLDFLIPSGGRLPTSSPVL